MLKYKLALIGLLGCLVLDNANAQIWGGGSGAAVTPAGATGQLQKNNAGALGASFTPPTTVGTAGDIAVSSGSLTVPQTWITPTTCGGTPAIGDIYYVSGTNTCLTIADVVIGAILCSGGVAGIPTYCNSFISKGASPTIHTATCGTSPTISGTDDQFTITVGTGGTATTCQVDFNLSSARRCGAAISSVDKVVYSYTPSAVTSTITITAAAAFTAGSTLTMLCQRGTP